MNEFIKTNFKKCACIALGSILFYLTFLSVLQIAFTGDYVWFDRTISMIYAVFLFTLFPIWYRNSWRSVAGYIICFILYVCLDLSICPFKLCDEYIADSIYIRGYVIYDTCYYVAAWLVGFLGNQAKNIILTRLCYLLSAIVCVAGLWHTLLHWYIWISRYFLWNIYMPGKCFF